MIDIGRERDPGVSDHQPVAVGEVLNVIRRRKAVVLSVIFVVTALATFYGWWIEPTYTATATVMIDSGEDGVVEDGQISSVGSSVLARNLETQSNVIQSVDVIITAMEETGAFKDPHFARASEEGLGPATISKVSELLRELIGVPPEWLPTEWLTGTGLAATNWLHNEWHSTSGDGAVGDSQGADLSTTDLSMDSRLLALQDEVAEMEKRLETEESAILEAEEHAIDVFTKNLRVTPSGEANILSVSYTHPDPAKAASIVNALIAAYVARQLRAKRTSSDLGYTWLSERLEALQSDVLSAEDAVERFRTENNLASTGGTTLSEVQLADLNRELIRTRAERAESEAKLRLIEDLRGSGKNLDSIAEVVGSPLIAKLREQEMLLVQREGELATTYGPQHPRIEEVHREQREVAAGINAEVNRIARSLENELAVVMTRERKLVEELEGIRAKRSLEDQMEVRLRQLEREAAAKRIVYEGFLSRQQELKAREGLQASNVHVLTPARVPLEPSSPSTALFAAVGFTASTVLGCMLGLLREQLDKSLRSERQVEQGLGLRCLGVVPRAKGLKRGRGKLVAYLCGKPRSAYAEGIRALYGSLLVIDGGVAPLPKTILVTSALPGEGKSTTACSLAVSAARAGQNVVLVDFDLRRPNVAREFGCRPNAGVVEVLTGKESLDQALISNVAAGLDILAVVSGSAETTALLTGQRIHVLLGELRQRYDYIVLDSPPLLPVTDARLLALHADATVFVVQWQHTKVDAATSGLKVLRDAGVRVVGAVLTQVHLKKHARLRYGDGVQYLTSYGNYYHD